MDSFNLIPNEYREAQHKRRLVMRLLAGSGALLFALTVGLQHMQQVVLGFEQEADELRMKKAVSTREQTQLTDLSKYKKALNGQALLLDSLRSGAPMNELIRTIEHAVTDTDVRFVSWHFRRSGIVTKDDPQVRAPSYFVIAKKPSEFPTEWHALTHMTIHGQAENHAALSAFVQQLFQHPTVDDVKVQRSTQESSGVRFNLAVMVKTQGHVS